MKTLGRRFLYLLIILVWLSAMLFPIAAVRLATNEQIEIGSTRVFLVQSRTQGGVGIQTAREVTREADCTIHSIRYIMWKGEAENARTCSCADGTMREPQGRRCAAP